MIDNTKLPHISLSISCVYYDTELEVFSKTLNSITRAVEHAKNHGIIQYSELHLINNNPLKENEFLQLCTNYNDKLDGVIIHNGHGNIGYGLGNNLAIHYLQSTYHLIINPDVIVSLDAISVGIRYMNDHSGIGLVAPHATNPDGKIEYLAKRLPKFTTILLRGLNNTTLNRIFKKQLDIYAYKDKIPTNKPFEIQLASGCFMLCDTKVIKKINGFSKDYFLYFEDFDFSRRINKLAKILYIPQMTIIHAGGNAATKGISHTKLFLKSFLKFKLTIFKSL